MKRLLIIVAVMMTAMTASAQFSFGVKGGANVTSMSLSSDVLKSSNRAGFYIGPTAKFTLPIVGIGFDASVLYDQREGTIGDGENEETMRQQQIAVPVNLRYQIGLGDLASVLVFAGPQFGFNLNDGIKDIDWEWKKTNLSFNVGAGVMLIKKLQITANYNIAAGKTGEFSVLNAAGEALGVKDAGDGKLNSWQIGLAYYF